MSDESRLHLLNNGISPRQKRNMEGLNVTLSELRAELQAERAENEKMVQWYMRQFPELVARMLSDALKANGLTLLPPSWAGTIMPPAVSPEGPGDTSPAETIAPQTEVPPVTGT